jgi:hypothetical protein
MLIIVDVWEEVDQKPGFKEAKIFYRLSILCGEI